MLEIIILLCPIICLIASIIYCIFNIWHANSEVKPIEFDVNVRFAKNRKKNERGWKTCAFIMDVLSFLGPVISAAFFWNNRPSDPESYHLYPLNSFFALLFFAILYFVSCKTELIDTLQKFDGFRTFFSKKPVVIAFSSILFAVAIFFIYKRFFSHIVFGYTPSGDNFIQIFSGAVSFLLIGSALWTCTQKMLSHIN